MEKELRYLTEKEITYICDVIPESSSVVSDISKNIQKQIKFKLAQELSELKIYPDIIEELRSEIYNQFQKSIVTPGEPIGLTTGEAIGQQTTQMNLNTFHVSGSSKTMETGTLKTLLNATLLKNPITVLHFNNKSLSYDDVIKYEKELIEITISKILLDVELKTSYVESDWWYPLYLNLNKITIENKDIFLRLYFNIDLLYSYDITLEIIKNKCFNNKNDSVICVLSPTNLGIIDVYINNCDLYTKSKKKMDNLDLNMNCLEMCFINVILPEFKTKIIKGIKGFYNLTPISVNTVTIIKYDKYISDYTFEIGIDYFATLNDGITFLKLENLFKECDIKILNKTDTVYKIKINDNFLPIISFIEKSVSKHINIESFIYNTLTNTFEIKYNLRNIKINDKNKDADWVLKFDKNNPKWQETINYSTLNWQSSLIKILFTNILSFNSDYINIQYSDTIKTYIKILYDNEVFKSTVFIKNEKLKGNKYPIYFNALITEYTYYYAELIGSNLKLLLQHPDVDPKHTISNNIQEILQIFDIEVARNIIAMFCDKIIKSNGGYINSRHINFLADFMTNSGNIIPITSKGIAKTNRGVFADASFEQPIDFFIKSAFVGKTEISDFTSTSIFMGKRISIGTGYVNLKLDNKVINNLNAITNNEEKEPNVLNPYNDYDADKFSNPKFYTDNYVDEKYLSLPEVASFFDAPSFIISVLASNNLKISEEDISDFINFNL